MFVVFEGIDGSGKTTLSDKVSRILEEQGVSTFHARPKGELKSKLASRIRDMARDPRALTMSPHTELFLYLARDSQMIDTVIRPALEKATVVIADRYVYSPGILCRARGLIDDSDIQKATDVIARGLWPELVVYCDVDIHTSDRRKKLDKIVDLREPDDFGRKGLRGLGLRRAMRDDYLQIAAGDSTWMTVDNANHSIVENSILIANRILSALGKPAVAMPEDLPTPATLSDTSVTATRTRVFYDYLNRIAADGYVRMALYHARSLNDESAWKLRDTHMEKEPAMTAIGLEPLSSDRALAMRRVLLERVPRHVALSLKSFWADAHPEAYDMRKKLAALAPAETAESLNRIDNEMAWEIRDALFKDKDNRGSVLASLRGIDTERAWAMRRSSEKKSAIWGLLEGLSSINSDEAWSIRLKNEGDYLPWVILSTTGLDDRRAWEVRYRLENQATKLVIKSLSGIETDEAWDMRDRQGLWDKETVASVKGSDHPRAWKLRETLMRVWPGYVARSVGVTLGATERGRAFLEKLSAMFPNDPDVAHYLVKLDHQDN